MNDPKKITLADVRNQIDEIDSTFLELLKKRLECAKKIGQLKAQKNKAKWDPLRERQIIERLLKENDSVFPEQPLLSIYHEIINTCRLSQKKVVVAYLGPEATFSHLAGVKYFGHAADFKPCETIEESFIEVERERTQYAIVPVENSIEGAVTSTLDSFIKYKVKICGELNLGISHNLVNQSGRLEDIKLVASHAQPLAQCRGWLKKNLPNVPTQNVFSTGVASKMAADDPSVAAVASSLAIKTYQLQLVAKSIEDYRGNTTRFLLIGKESPGKSGKDKTSLLVSLMDRPGALNDALSILAERSLNLTRIESRPVKDEPGRYLFFMDMLGHMEDEDVRQGCAKLQEACSYYEWLGSYPCADND
ncbi:MAG: prephenate dehydratase [Desulfobulbaceae bacterium]|nr:prephenate dehydratase [Desulfobulbaceae bacterium]HIJ78850.1 prephenate dehydratase [Deltaproteobacteria bacterium]